MANAMVAVGPFGGEQGAMQVLTEKPIRLESITICSTKNGAGGQISAISFTYINSAGTSTAVGPWGTPASTDVRNQVNIPAGAYVVQLSGTVQNNVKSLVVVTSTGDLFGPFGDENAGNEFKIRLLEGAILGFFGRSGTLLNAVGAYVGTKP